MFNITQTVTPSKTDCYGRMKLFSALQLLQDCSEMWKSSEPAYRDFLLNNGAAQLLSFRQVDIIRVPELGEELTCSTSIYGIQGAFGYRNTAIYDAAGKPCYLCWCIGAFVNTSSGRLIRIPQEVIEQMTLEPQLNMEYRSRKIVLPDVEEQFLPKIAVQRNDIDYNRHVNNAHYIRMALELLPEDFVPASLRVDYKRPILPGTVITPTLMLQDNTAYVRLRVGDTICCDIEFTC